MLISITEKCRMGCSHCMEDAKPDNENFMSFEMFKKVVDFNFQYDFTITITGAEPTEHPMFWEFMDYLAGYIGKNNIVTVVTNGMNLSDNDIPKIESLREKSNGNILWQVTNVKPYYPIQIDLNQKIFKLKEFTITTELQKLNKRGRAANHPEWHFNSKAPQCFNFRSTLRSTNSLGITISFLRGRGYFCTPKISYDGHIKCGESNLCPNVAHIDEPVDLIVKKIHDFTCDNKYCWEVLNRLSKLHRNAIGEK